MQDEGKARLLLERHSPDGDGVLCSGCRDGRGRLVAVDYCTDRLWALAVHGASDGGPEGL